MEAHASLEEGLIFEEGLTLHFILQLILHIYILLMHGVNAVVNYFQFSMAKFTHRMTCFEKVSYMKYIAKGFFWFPVTK